MTETTTKSVFAPFDTKFEMPKFEIPNFDMPKFEVPAAFREAAEKGVAQAKEGWEKMKSATEEATEVLEEELHDRRQGRVRIRPQGDRRRAHQHQRGFRFRHQSGHREDALRIRRNLVRRMPASNSTRSPRRPRN